jgi:hypothetical protein
VRFAVCVAADGIASGLITKPAVKPVPVIGLVLTMTRLLLLADLCALLVAGRAGRPVTAHLDVAEADSHTLGGTLVTQELVYTLTYQVV